MTQQELIDLIADYSGQYTVTIHVRGERGTAEAVYDVAIGDIDYVYDDGDDETLPTVEGTTLDLHDIDGGWWYIRCEDIATIRKSA